MMLTIISLGSNLGDRLSYLQFAVDQIGAIPKTSVTKISSIYETKPQLYLDQPNFYNAIVEVETELEPVELLSKLKLIELAASRERIIENGPRTLDLDIIISSSLMDSDSEIQLPHPRAQFRQFVLLPWLEIDPEAILGSLGKASSLSSELGDQGVKRFNDLRLR
jgi:2-amino-4-hydroxy-6-hydroxymethyldihydropteridine diphosphokinase